MKTLLLSIFVCLAAGFIGTLFTTPAIPTWYASLNKPFFSPPNWVFAPVWTTLYILMGVSLNLIWTAKSKKSERKIGLKFFWIQLVLNSLWSIVFFGLKSPVMAFIVIVLLWIFIFLTIKNFLKISKTAGLLLLPYIVWVSFASVLNLAIVLLNK
jgi:tryptophan-rich sensory protein